MFERYTEKARRVIFFAREEASEFGSPYVEGEHLLMGLLREDKAPANRFLRSQAAVESIRKQIENHLPIREKFSTSVDLPLSHESSRVLAFAAEESQHLNHQHIGTEHLLLGLLREENALPPKFCKSGSAAFHHSRATEVNFGACPWWHLSEIPTCWELIGNLPFGQADTMDRRWLTTHNQSDGNAIGIGSYSPSRRSRMRNSENPSRRVFVSVAGKNRASARIPAESAAGRYFPKPHISGQS
jgi:hypothetical protein